MRELFSTTLQISFIFPNMTKKEKTR